MFKWVLETGRTGGQNSQPLLCNPALDRKKKAPIVKCFQVVQVKVTISRKETFSVVYESQARHVTTGNKDLLQSSLTGRITAKFLNCYFMAVESTERDKNYPHVQTQQSLPFVNCSVHMCTSFV